MPDEKKGKTLWEMFRERVGRAGHANGNGDGASIALSNPLDWRIGEAESFAAANGAEYLDFTFTVKEIRECVRRLGSAEFSFTDYTLHGVNPQGGAANQELLVRVRAMPKEKGGQDLLLLRMEDEFTFTEEFLAVVKDTTGCFEVTDDATGKKETFTRVNGLSEPWEAEVLIVSATDPDGKALPGHATHGKLQYWDYSRAVEGGDGRVEFLFVEMNGDTGWFQIWRGAEFFE